MNDYEIKDLIKLEVQNYFQILNSKINQLEDKINILEKDNEEVKDKIQLTLLHELVCEFKSNTNGNFNILNSHISEINANINKIKNQNNIRSSFSIDEDGGMYNLLALKEYTKASSKEIRIMKHDINQIKQFVKEIYDKK